MNDVEIWYLMIPIAMVFVAIAIAVFFWSVKSDQFEDLDRHGSNILFDDDEVAHQQAQRNVQPAQKQDSHKQQEQHDHSA
ncbi:cbb3-type cytochrome oxidase assembly protein CcoS [Oceanisphaera sp. KMM 10153]|uniref:cbb3-type cytochrome oxidase assembly protein CcoS n=1 Tax=Oceanisphaera submarina TaxID=3390193 RepID=UPI0039768C77